jgi:hypothetical protein
MNMYMLIIYTIHGPCGDIMLSYDLQLHVECNSLMQLKQF